MLPANTFVDYMCIVKINQQFTLGIPLIVSSTRATREPAHTNCCCSSADEGRTPMDYTNLVCPSKELKMTDAELSQVR